MAGVMAATVDTLMVVLETVVVRGCGGGSGVWSDGCGSSGVVGIPVMACMLLINKSHSQIKHYIFDHILTWSLSSFKALFSSAISLFSFSSCFINASFFLPSSFW